MHPWKFILNDASRAQFDFHSIQSVCLPFRTCRMNDSTEMPSNRLSITIQVSQGPSSHAPQVQFGTLPKAPCNPTRAFSMQHVYRAHSNAGYSQAYVPQSMLWSGTRTVVESNALACTKREGRTGRLLPRGWLVEILVLTYLRRSPELGVNRIRDPFYRQFHSRKYFISNKKNKTVENTE